MCWRKSKKSKKELDFGSRGPKIRLHTNVRCGVKQAEMGPSGRVPRAQQQT